MVVVTSSRIDKVPLEIAQGIWVFEQPAHRIDKPETTVAKAR
jgi:hypothetical protein